MASHAQARFRLPADHRQGSSDSSAGTPTFPLPDASWLCDTWHVTHSTLPMWKDKRNVCITYSSLPEDRLDDLVSYQALDSDKKKEVRGVDSPVANGAYSWRGKGWLKIASSRWEILGWGKGAPKDSSDTGAEEESSGKSTQEDWDWVVTYFAKTLFTPAGIDIYSRRPEGLSRQTVEGLKSALMELESSNQEDGARSAWQNLVDEMFEVNTDASQ